MSVSPTIPLAGSNIQNNPNSENILVMNQGNERENNAENCSPYENVENRMNAANKSSSKTKLNVKIRAWNGVATWKWIANDDTCGICRVAFDGCCPGN